VGRSTSLATACNFFVGVVCERDTYVKVSWLCVKGLTVWMGL
jgi:hypothetical protein